MQKQTEEIQDEFVISSDDEERFDESDMFVTVSLVEPSSQFSLIVLALACKG